MIKNIKLNIIILTYLLFKNWIKLFLKIFNKILSNLIKIKKSSVYITLKYHFFVNKNSVLKNRNYFWMNSSKSLNVMNQFKLRNRFKFSNQIVKYLFLLKSQSFFLTVPQISSFLESTNTILSSININMNIWICRKIIFHSIRSRIIIITDI